MDTTKSSFIIAKSEASRDICIGQLDILACTWDENTRQGCSIRQALRYLKSLDFKAPAVFEQVQDYCHGQDMERVPE